MWGTNAEDTYNFTAGFHATLDDWSIDGYAESGQVQSAVHVFNDAIDDKTYLASDAVVNPANGRSSAPRPCIPPPSRTFAAEAVGCQPLNVFGNGAPSPAALKYILGTEIDHTLTQQNVFDISAHGEPISDWAGPIGCGVWRDLSHGFGQRHGAEPGNRPPRSSPTPGIRAMPSGLNGKLGGYELNDVQAIAGRISVGEGFVETQVPLAKDEPWAKSLNFNAAGRLTDYSVGGIVTTWKLGLVYQPIEDVRLRVSGSEDIRAPNISELYTAATVGGLGITDPCP
ncbi:MAG: TonB-dependent receptor [Rhizomicrobium sp.]